MSLIFKLFMLSFFSFLFSSKSSNIQEHRDTSKLADSNKVYQFTLNDIDGKPQSLSQYKGKVIVIVNTASKCGLTPQYESIEKFYEAYKDKNVVVLGFPANNFLGQEPGTESEIKEFCSARFNVSFPMFSKISVKGSEINALYQFLTNKSLNGVANSSVKWNFQKYIIDKNGFLVGHIPPTTTLADSSFLNTIQQLIAE